MWRSEWIYSETTTSVVVTTPQKKRSWKVIFYPRFLPFLIQLQINTLIIWEDTLLTFSLYHPLFPNPQHTVSLYNIYVSRISLHGREGKVTISRTQRNILRYSSIGITDTGIVPDTSVICHDSPWHYLTDFRVCELKFMYLLVTWKRLRGLSRHHLSWTMWTNFIKLSRKEGRNSHVTQDHIGVCHIKTKMNKKASEHMNFRTHTRNTSIPTDKSAFSGSTHDQCDYSFRSPLHITGLVVCGTWMSVFYAPTWCGENTFCCLTPVLLDVLLWSVPPSFLGRCGHGVFVSFLGRVCWGLVARMDFFACNGRWWLWCVGTEGMDGMGWRCHRRQVLLSSRSTFQWSGSTEVEVIVFYNISKCLTVVSDDDIAKFWTIRSARDLNFERKKWEQVFNYVCEHPSSRSICGYNFVRVVWL